MKILLIASECAPYYSTGGLADVVYGLAKELTNHLEDVRILVPRYRRTFTQLPSLERVVGDMRVDLGSSLVEGDEQGAYHRNANILKSSGTPSIYFVEQEFYFGRDKLYGYPDDYERFIFFGLAALNMLCDETFRSRESDWFPDIIQGYDWATGLMPRWLHQYAKRDQRFNAVRFVLNIHNPRRMGIFGSRSLQLAKQDSEGIYQEVGEKDERVNFLGRGILFADKIVTVNPHFDDPEAPLETNLPSPLGSDRKMSRNPLPEPARILKQALTQRLREGDLVGIRNGIDEEDYDPSRKDPALPAQFGPFSLKERLKNKLALQRMLGFVPDECIPLFGMVSRLIPINGYQFLQALHDKLKEVGELQLAVLAAGGHSDLREMLSRWEGEQDANRPWIKSRFIREPDLAKLIYAGCDVFLIPARELPSGITQFIAMRYGAVPLVYHTGALCDSVEEYQEMSKLPTGLSSGVGFTFYEYSDEAFLKAVKDALAVYRRDDPAAWRNIQLHNMRQHFNWAQPAADYLELYQSVLHEKPVPIRSGTRLQLNREARLLQAILEVDNLHGLGARSAQDILKQAGGIIRGVLGCDAVYVWNMEKNLGGEMLEANLDRPHHQVEPQRDEVAKLLNQGAADIWGPVGDTDLSGICRPLVGLGESKLAHDVGWVTGKSVPVTAHGRLLGRIDVLHTQKPDLDDDHWQTMALTALASAFGQWLYAVRGAKELETVCETAGLLLETRSFDEALKVIINRVSEVVPATRIWLYHRRGPDLVPVGNAEEAEICLAPASQVVKLGEKLSLVDWVDAPRGSDGRRLYRSLLALPLQAPNRQPGTPFGVIVLAHVYPRAFTQEQEQFLERRLLPQAASALTTTGWYQERDQTRVSQLRKLSESLVSGSDFENLPSKIVTTTMEVLKAEGASLYLLNQETDKLEIRAAAGYHEPLMQASERPSYDIGEGLTGWVAQRDEPFRANSKDELHSSTDEKQKKRWAGKFKHLQGNREPNAFLGIPLKVEGRLIGVLKLEDRTLAAC